MGIDITSFFIYRFRYWIGYILIGLLLMGVLVFAGLYAPGGISDQEMAAVVKSSTLSITDISSLGVTNMPFHLLQQASINLFGVSNFSIKLPSLVIALLSAIGLILLLQRWFTPRIAVLASLIAISTGQFLFIAQSGTPGILYVLWSVWLLLLGTLIAKRINHGLLWKMLFFAVAALSLYTPLSIYALVALTAAAFIHPHLRYVMSQLSRQRIIKSAPIAIVLLIPLIIGIFKNPSMGLEILGITAAWPDIPANLTTLFNQYLGFATASTTGLMTPVFGLGSMLIIGYGAYRLIKTRDSTQSYLIIIWLVCLIPVLVISPKYTSVTFLPLVLLMATGLQSLLGYWYRLFPRNPYARIAGLIPLIVLISALMLTGLERYVYGYHYDPDTSSNFSLDLALLPKDTDQLMVTSAEQPFYSIVASHSKAMTIISQPVGDGFVATKDANRTFPRYQLTKVVTSGTQNDADRFYIYKKTNP